MAALARSTYAKTGGKKNEQNAVAYENLPHARSVAHQISLLPPTMTTPNAIHSYVLDAMKPRASTGRIIAR